MWVNLYPSSLLFTLACSVILILKVILLKPIIKTFQLYYLASLFLCALGIIVGINGFSFLKLMNVGNFQIVSGVISSIIFIWSYELYKKAFLAQVNEIDEHDSLNYDVSIKKCSEDALNRKNIAERVFAIINTSDERSRRISICGQWGDGKTSIMNMVKEKCHDSKFVVAWFNPWLYKTKNDLWVGFRMAFEDAVIRHGRGTNMPFIWTRLMAFFATLVSLKVAQIPIGRALEKLIQSSGTPGQNTMKSNIETLLKQYFDGEKVIIFIDDLDRVDDPKITLELLKGIKELLDLRSITFIVAFDEDVVAQTIEKNMPANSGRLFLEKIIDYRIYVPHPMQSEIACLMEDNLSNLSVNKAVIMDIQNLIPTNPRKLKRFLHYLDVLHPTLERFDDNELNLHLIYIAQLLCLEFPEAIRNIIKNSTCQKYFTPVGLVEKHFQKEEATKGLGSVDSKKTTQDWENGYYLGIATVMVNNIEKLSSDEKSRLVQLIQGIQERIPMNDQYEYDILFNFRVLEYSRLMSWKEFIGYFQQIQAKQGFGDILSEIDVQEEYLAKLVNYRLKQIQKINSVRTKVEADECKNTVLTSGEQLNLLMNSNNLESYSIELKSHIFHMLLEEIFAIKNAKEENGELLRQTSEVINRLIDLVKEDAIILYDILKKEEHNKSYFKSKNSESIKCLEEFEAKVTKNVVDNLINKFEKPNAIRTILFAKDSEALFLLKKSQFHTEKVYESFA